MELGNLVDRGSTLDLRRIAPDWKIGVVRGGSQGIASGVAWEAYRGVHSFATHGPRRQRFEIQQSRVEGKEARTEDGCLG